MWRLYVVPDDQLDVGNVCNEDALAVGCLERELAIDSPTNIVAYASVDTVCKVLHGKHLSEEIARVSITRVIQGSAKIPFPIKDEITTVGQAV